MHELLLLFCEDDARRLTELRDRFELQTHEEALRVAVRLAHGRHVADRRVVPSEDDDFFAEMSRQLETGHEGSRELFERIAAKRFRVRMGSGAGTDEGETS